jgi:hypothetical protein
LNLDGNNVFSRAVLARESHGFLTILIGVLSLKEPLRPAGGELTVVVVLQFDALKYLRGFVPLEVGRVDLLGCSDCDLFIGLQFNRFGEAISVELDKSSLVFGLSLGPHDNRQSLFFGLVNSCLGVPELDKVTAAVCFGCLE